VDRIWYTSRTGSSGNMYTCTAGSGGCGATSLYQRLRTADDDDGNLANGHARTPPPSSRPSPGTTSPAAPPATPPTRARASRPC
jgi:hypothetical protein